jgi:G3E family GTPase
MLLNTATFPDSERVPKATFCLTQEFGDTPIDDALVSKNSKFKSDEEIIEVLNGCICCTVRKDLIKTLTNLGKRIQAGKLHLDGIIIETTGMADPAPVAQTFLVDADIRAFARLDGIVTLVDAKHIEQHLDEKKASGVVNEAESQIAFADRLLLNKTDLVSEEDVERVEARLRAINQVAPIQRCKYSDVSVGNVLNIHGFDLSRALKSSPDLLNANRKPTKHDGTVTSVSLDQGAPRHLRLVQKGNIDLDLLQDWINEVMRDQGEDVFRMKGILSIEHAEQRYVYHSVHMIFSGGFDEPWGEGEARESKLVFIGRNLNAESLAARFNGCLATPKNLKKKADSLRFTVGTRIECNMGCHWAPGTVVALLWRGDFMGPGTVAPYQIRLDGDDPDGSPRLIFAPADDDRIVRLIVEEGKVAELAVSEVRLV